MVVGPRLRYWREKRGVTLEELADRLTIAPDCLAEVEEGRRRMAMAAWQEAAAFLQVPLEELLQDSPPPDGEPSSPPSGNAASPGSAPQGGGEEAEGRGSRCETGIHVKARVGATVRALREKKGMTVTDLARVTGLSPAHISEIERGRTAASVATLEKLAAALGVSPGVLVRSVGANGVGEKLRRLRERLGLTQKEVAEKAGVSYGLIGQIESGRTQSSVTTLSRLAEALGVSPCYFLMDEDEVLEVTRSLSPEVADLLAQPRVREFLAQVGSLDRASFEVVMAVVQALVARLPRPDGNLPELLRELGDLMRDLGPEEQRFLMESARFLASRKTRGAS